MSAGKKHWLLVRTALVLAAWFSLLSMAQAARPLHSINPFTSAFAASRQHITRHVLQEVSPRGSQPQAPKLIVALLPVIPVSQHCVLPRMTAYVPQWPIQDWPMHRRLAPAADKPQPA